MSLQGSRRFAHAGQAATDAQPRYGVVSSVNPVNYTARVLIQPEGLLSGWLPLHTVWIGNGWGMVCPPLPGDQVTLEADAGDPNNLTIKGRVFSATQTPPSANPGEFVLVHQSGSFIKLLNDGGIHSSGLWSHVGGLNVTGTITATVDVIANGKSGHNHTHGGVASGANQTLPPT